MKKITLTIAAFVAAISMNAQTVLFEDDFSGGDLSGFEIEGSESSETWVFSDVGTHDSFAMVEYDEALVPQDEKLIIPLDLSDYTTAQLEFNWNMSYYWSIDPEENYDLNVLVSTDGGQNYTEIWDETQGQQFDSADENFLWLEERTVPQDLEIINLDDYAGMSDVRIAFQYLGVDGASASIDDITVTADTNASVDDFAAYDFSYVMNNATGQLSLNANIPMSNVKLYNVLGQNVMDRNLSQSSETFDLNNLTSGVYIVKLAIDGKTGSFKIVKK